MTTVDHCEQRTGQSNLFDCSFGVGVGGEDPSWFTVRLQSDGALSKVLGEHDPVPGEKSPAETAALLAADDELQRAPSRTRGYACKPSPRVEPDGTRAGSALVGQLCTTRARLDRAPVRRYVEFAPDGTVTRDYVVQRA